MSKASNYNRRKAAYSKGFKDGQAAATPSASSVAVKDVVPDRCSGISMIFEGGCLHVRKDGSGHIVVDEDDFILEDDRREGENGPEGSVHWIARFPAGEMTALRDFLNGQGFSAQVQDVTCDTCNDTGKEARHQICRDCDDGWYDEEKLTPDEAWTILCETPDITSPEEYPDHALITFEQLRSYMERAAPAKQGEAEKPAWRDQTIFDDAEGRN